MSKFKRAPNGFGTIIKLSGNRRKPYYARGPAYETIDGYKRDSIGYFETRQEALDALAARRLNPERPISADKLRLSELYAEWKQIAFVGISQTTIDNYRASWNYLAPLATYPVKDIRTAHWQKVLDRVCRSGKSASTVKKVRLLMNRLSEYAVETDIIDKNYANFTKLPKFEQTEKDIFNDIELLKIERGAANNVGISSIILFMCYTGWRIQEVCNLTVFNYNETERTLTGGIKTDAGKNRTVFIPDKVIEIVRHYASQNGPALFCYELNGRLQAYNTKRLRTEFYNTLDSLGIQSADADPKRLTPHSTRHTYNSMLNRAGVDTATRMKLMGQVSEQTNQRVYTHTDLEQMKKAVSALG